MDYYLILMIAGSGVLAGGAAYAVTGRDLRGGGRAAVALACGLLVAAASLFVPYLPVLVLLGAAAAHLVLRRLFTAGAALAASGAALFAGCSFSVLLMMAALETM